MIRVIEGKGRPDDRSLDLKDALMDVIYDRAEGLTVIAVVGALEAVKFEVLRMSEKD